MRGCARVERRGSAVRHRRSDSDTKPRPRHDRVTSDRAGDARRGRGLSDARRGPAGGVDAPYTGY